MIVGEIQVNDEPNMAILYASIAILLLAISNFIIRFASNRYPSEQERAIERRA